MNTTIWAGILHDTYPDENGVEVSYTEKVVAYKKGGKYELVSVPGFCTFQMSKKDFFSKVTDLKEIFN